jgi:ElaA protein
MLFPTPSVQKNGMNWHWRRYRDLSLDELYAMLVLRQKVFVVEQQCAYLDADGLDQDGWHLLGMDDQGKIVAYLRVLAPGSRFSQPSIGRVIVLPELRGKGVGKEIMVRGMRKVEELHPGESICMYAQAYLEEFYSDLGFERGGDPYEEDGILHVDMIRYGDRPPSF